MLMSPIEVDSSVIPLPYLLFLLPLFPLKTTETYHMVDRCDPTIATWSSSGDSFVIKNVDVFSAVILPQYFKHSNFVSVYKKLFLRVHVTTFSKLSSPS